MLIVPRASDGSYGAVYKSKEILQGGTSYGYCCGAHLHLVRVQDIMIPSSYYRTVDGVCPAQRSSPYLTGFADRGIVSAYLHGNDKRLKTMQRPSRPSQVGPCSHRRVSEMPRTSASMGMSIFRNPNSERHSGSVISSRLNSE